MNEADSRTEWLELLLKKDYSWDGLKKKKISGLGLSTEGSWVAGTGQGLRGATLQDFWREEETRLIDTPNGRFTRWHVPPGEFESNRPGAHEVVDKIISAIQLIGPLQRGQEARLSIPFDGVGFESSAGFVAGSSLLGEAGFLWSLRDAFAVSPFAVSDLQIDTLNISAMAFLRDFACRNSSIGLLSALETTFHGDCAFEGVRFRNQDFSKARFLKGCFLIDCRFEETFNFRGLTIADWFYPMGCNFAKGIGLHQCRIGTLHWKNCRAEQLSLNEVHVTATIWAAANDIKRLYAKGLTCGGKFELDDGDGSQWLYLSGATLGGDVSFHRVPTVEKLEAEGTTFLGDANFKGLNTKSASFSEAAFRKAVNFEGATFDGPARFDHVEWPDDARHYTSAFRDVRFLEGSNFSTSPFNAVAAFAETHFSRPPLFKLEEGARGDQDFEIMLDQARRAAEADRKEGRKPNKRGADPYEDYYGALEGGARVLKQAMENRRARSLEHRLYRYELIARRHRPSIGGWERSLSWLFGAVSNYGNSSLRPLAILVALTVLSGWGYAIWAALLSGGVDERLVGDGITFAGRNVFRPFEVWTSQRVPIRPGIETALLMEGSWTALLARLAGSVQSFLSLILIFLVALSLKRQFQLN